MDCLGEQLERWDEVIREAGVVEDAEDGDRARQCVLAGAWEQGGKADVADGSQDDRIVLAGGVPMLPEQESCPECSLFIIGDNVDAGWRGSVCALRK